MYRHTSNTNVHIHWNYIWQCMCKRRPSDVVPGSDVWSVYKFIFFGECVMTVFQWLYCINSQVCLLDMFVFQQRMECRIAGKRWLPTKEWSATALYPWCLREAVWRKGSDAVAEDRRAFLPDGYGDREGRQVRGARWIISKIQTA